MNSARVILAFAALTAVGATASSRGPTALGPQQEDVEATIRAVHRQMQTAAEKLDATELYAYVLETDTPPIVEDGVLLESHAAALANTRGGLGALSRLSYKYRRNSVTLLAKDAALWVADGVATATLQDGREVLAPFAESIVFVRRDGAWKVLHAHRSAPNAR